MVKNNDRESRESSLASGWTVEGQLAAAEVTPAANTSGREDAAVLGAAQSEAAVVADGGEPPKQLSSGALVMLGLIGGLYLLYTIVWFSWANAKSLENQAVAEGSGSIGSVLQQLVFWVAPFAPALWFVSVLVLTRESKLWQKALWLVVGAVILVPLPMFGKSF